MMTDPGFQIFVHRRRRTSLDERAVPRDRNLRRLAVVFGLAIWGISVHVRRGVLAGRETSTPAVDKLFFLTHDQPQGPPKLPQFALLGALWRWSSEASHRDGRRPRSTPSVGSFSFLGAILLVTAVKWCATTVSTTTRRGTETRGPLVRRRFPPQNPPGTKLTVVGRQG